MMWSNPRACPELAGLFHWQFSYYRIYLAGILISLAFASVSPTGQRLDVAASKAMV